MLLSSVKYTHNYFYIFTILSICTISYWTGLQGPFLFDDYANLTSLGDYNGVRNWETLKLFISSGHAGPTGRPISLLSFLLDARDWPADPWHFKFTNLILHLINGALLYLIINRIFYALGKNSQDRHFLSLVATGFWLFNPFFVSTILYPVQRMAILPVTFTLIGFLLYFKGRSILDQAPRKGIVYFILGIGVCTVLAVFSKENGVILPLLVTVTEYFILKDSDRFPNLSKKYWGVFLLLPSIIIVVAFIYKTPSFINGYSHRDFTATERLLTQPRAIVSYLYHLYIPQMMTNGLYTDSFMKSQGLLHPVTTLYSFIIVIILALLSWVYRKRAPLFAFSMSFFFLAHIIESSIIPLELYFEHRNYLPALFLFLPITTILFSIRNKYSYGKYIPVLFLSIFVGFTFMRSNLWGNEVKLMTSWAISNPTSIRAQRTAALTLENRNQLLEADSIIQIALLKHPKNQALLGDQLRYDCFLGRDPVKSLSLLEWSLNNHPFDYHYMPFMSSLLTDTLLNCHKLTTNHLFRLINTLRKNQTIKNSEGLLRQLMHAQGAVYLSIGQYEQARKSFQESLEKIPDTDLGMAQVSLLAEKRAFKEALKLLEFVESTSTSSYQDKSSTSYNTEIIRIRSFLLDDIQEEKENLNRPL